MALGYIAQWLERLTADQQVPGSNPGVPLPTQGSDVVSQNTDESVIYFKLVCDLILKHLLT